ncbi:hypothetical protein ZWY2020_044286 [Hordeum vulgare]|nr:hypothetical protein ZWY2020_044286 [Hordeum vulgare]
MLATHPSDRASYPASVYSRRQLRAAQSLLHESRHRIQSAHDIFGPDDGGGTGAAETGSCHGGGGPGPSDGQRPEEGRTSMAKMAAKTAALRTRPAAREAIVVVDWTQQGRATLVARRKICVDQQEKKMQDKMCYFGEMTRGYTLMSFIGTQAQSLD